jgi:sodium transport system permease protein
VPQLSTFRRQLLFNELGLFLALPLLMIWKYRLGWREALALRRVKPAIWVAALLAIPSGHVVAIGVFRLANLVLPVPKQVLEQFGREVLPDSIPLWQLVLFVSILPGICEEIAFRGPLLHGLRRKLRPAPLALAVGLIFGLFHVALFRIIPTGFLGVVLTAVALFTGSIFPCILIHAGNNAFGLWAAKTNFQVSTLHWWIYLVAAVVFCLSLYIFYRYRTPYPGLRKPTK